MCVAGWCVMCVAGWCVMCVAGWCVMCVARGWLEGSSLLANADGFNGRPRRRPARRLRSFLFISQLIHQEGIHIGGIHGRHTRERAMSGTRAVPFSLPSLIGTANLSPTHPQTPALTLQFAAKFLGNFPWNCTLPSNDPLGIYPLSPNGNWESRWMLLNLVTQLPTIVLLQGDIQVAPTETKLRNNLSTQYNELSGKQSGDYFHTY